jgi:hypothetical protein
MASKININGLVNTTVYNAGQQLTAQASNNWATALQTNVVTPMQMRNNSILSFSEQAKKFLDKSLQSFQ